MALISINFFLVNIRSSLNKQRAFAIRRFNINVPIRRRTDSPRHERREEAAARRTLRVMRRTPGILLTVLTNRISIARCQLSDRIIFDRLVRRQTNAGTGTRRDGAFTCCLSREYICARVVRRDCRVAHNYHETRNLGGRLPCERTGPGVTREGDAQKRSVPRKNARGSREKVRPGKCTRYTSNVIFIASTVTRIA